MRTGPGQAARRAHRQKLAKVPKDPRDQLFCERWLTHLDKERAYREAGFSTNVGHQKRALNKLEQFAEYLRPLKEAKEKLMVQRLVVDADRIVSGMAEKVTFDPSSFHERTTEPLTEEVKVGGKKVTRNWTWNGQPIYGERLKPYSDLTPEQRAVVQITSSEGERIRYRLPTIMEQHAYYTSLGRQLGMFAEKLIIERHNHQHVHATLDFNGVPTARILDLQRQLLPLAGVEFAQQLGFAPEDVEAAAKEMGVIMPAKAPA